MRDYCLTCLKVKEACYCHKIQKQTNISNVIILQHPSETKHAINTAKIAELSYNYCSIFIGEDFSNHNELNSLIKERNCYLLFPSNKSLGIEQFTSSSPITLIVIDGTWKKAKKILYLSKNLQSLNMLQLSNNYSPRYKIRKGPGDGYLSTLEAITYALEQIDQDNFSSVFEAFDYMINFQIKKMGKTIFKQNYLEKK